MGLPPVYGHETLLSRLERALASGRFPQAALLHGRSGVGKQRLALWIAAGLLCERGPGKPCEACTECRTINALTHPDLHWFTPIVRPKASDPAKQVDEAAQLLADALAERREGAPYRPADPMASHPLASIRLLQRAVGLTPFRGRCKVVILGDAERLIVQEASQEAANALLKVLEEPPADTVLILTAADPQALLPTVRSRVVPIRVPGVPDAAVRAFLAHELDPPPQNGELERLVGLADGSIGRALLADDAQTTRAEETAASLLDAVRVGPGGWAARALAQPPWSARGEFSATLDALAATLRSEIVEAATAGNRGRVAGRVRAIKRIAELRLEAAGNANPQLALAVLAGELALLQ